MLAKGAEDQSFDSNRFRETIGTLAVQARSWARWGRTFMLLGLIIGLLGLALFANVAMAADSKAQDEGDTLLKKGLRAPEGPYAWVALAIALMRFGYLLIQRSWELENKYLSLQVLTYGESHPETVTKMTKVIEKESERGNESRRPIVTRRRGPKPPPSPDR